MTQLDVEIETLAKAVEANVVPSCRDCKYYVPKSGSWTGYCYRYPPTATQSHGHTVGYAHPTVDQDDCWCGEFQRKP